MSPTSIVDPSIVVDLKASLRERERTEDRILKSIEDIGERLSRLEGSHEAMGARIESVAKNVHDLRQDLGDKGAFNPERQRAEFSRLTRDIVDERLGLFVKQMAEDQRKRDEALTRLLKIIATIGGSVAIAASWMAERWDQVGGLVKALGLFIRGGSQ